MPMTPEEYQKVKEAEKAHLRKLKELKKTHAQLSRKARITNAVTDMAESVQSLYDEHRTMVDRLEMDAISSEARLDVAMDGLEGDSSVQEALDAAQLEADQEVIKRARAKSLIEQMKLDGLRACLDDPVRISFRERCRGENGYGGYDSSITRKNYLKLYQILKERDVKYIAMQYPIRSVDELKIIFKGDEDIIFVSNENNLKKALQKNKYEYLFIDIFGGEFGHATYEGNKLIAKNVANAIFKELDYIIIR